MLNFPRDNTVLLYVRYNGYLHRCLGTLEDGLEPNAVRILPDQFPRGYAAEHDAADIVISDVYPYLQSVDEADHAWLCACDLNLDAAAGQPIAP